MIDRRSILFLDFDGVLHPDRVYLRKGRPELKGGGQTFMWVDHLVDVVHEFPEVEIVLSTSWARMKGFSYARRQLPPAIQDRVIGATWHSAMSFDYCSRSRQETVWDMSTRYQQIARYIQQAAVADWIAVDDDDDGWAEHLRHRLVHTDPERGLSDQLVLDDLRTKLATLGSS